MTAQAHEVHAARPAGRAAVDPIQLTGVLFVLVGGGFLLVSMLAASIAPGYDFHAAAISDLGVIAETALLFNGLLASIGVLEILAGVLDQRLTRRAGVATLTILAGIGAAGAGLVPLDRGDLHSLFALVAFLAINLQVTGLAMRVAGPLRWTGALAGVVGLAYAVLMVIGDAGNPGVFGAIGHGGAERMIAYPAMLWLVAFGGALMGRVPERAGSGR